MPYDMTDSYEQIIMLDAPIMRSFTVDFPVHAVVEKLEIGLKPDAELAPARPYRDFAPIVFYGSSIVHGTAATRPGLTYPAIISRELNMDYKNIGFSGMAKGERAIAEWMASLPMSVFVCDYDHNAQTVRAKNPDVPYIMITRPDYYTVICEQEHILCRRDVIMESYLKARAAGDKNVYFIDGISFGNSHNCYNLTVDSIHPNDAGFINMAENIGRVITHSFERKGL